MGGGADLGFGFSWWLCREWVLGCDGFESFSTWVIDLGHGFLWVGFFVDGN